MTQPSEETLQQMDALAAGWARSIATTANPKLYQQLKPGVTTLDYNTRVVGVARELHELTASNEAALEIAGDKLFAAIEAELNQAFPNATSVYVNRNDPRAVGPASELHLHLCVQF